jgi:sulfane dehydrogenase subunit SoxC
MSGRFQRRHLLTGMAALGLSLASKRVLGQCVPDDAPLPTASPILKPTPPNLFRILAPGAVEMRWDALQPQDYLVPQAMWYIHTRADTPKVDLATWRLRVEGSTVSQPQEFSYDQLLNMPHRTYIRACECGQNAHALGVEAWQRPTTGGVAFRLGAIYVAEFVGIPVRHILEQVGVTQKTKYVGFESLDKIGYTSTIPYEAAVLDDTLLVLAANGEPLLPDSGFPVRLFVSSWLGNVNVKWIKRIVTSDVFQPSQWDLHRAFVGPSYPPVPPYLGQPVTYQNVKSAFELAWSAELPAGRHRLYGRSWSGSSNIRSVDVSVDGGQTWQAATLIPPNLEKAWTRWSFEWQARPGMHQLQARATDGLGRIQPFSQPYNANGLSYGAVVSHPMLIR